MNYGDSGVLSGDALGTGPTSMVPASRGPQKKTKTFLRETLVFEETKRSLFLKNF